MFLVDQHPVEAGGCGYLRAQDAPDDIAAPIMMDFSSMELEKVASSVVPERGLAVGPLSYILG
jgi:hypothetical protein